MVSLILSNGELTTIVCALLEPQENPEIRQACQLLAAKLQPLLKTPGPQKGPKRRSLCKFFFLVYLIYLQ